MLKTAVEVCEMLIVGEVWMCYVQLSLGIEHLQCRAQRCRRLMLDGLLPKLTNEVVRAVDEDDRTAGLTKCTKARCC